MSRISDDETAKDIAHVEHYQLRVGDKVMLNADYLRDLHAQSAAASAGIERLKEENTRLMEELDDRKAYSLALQKALTGLSGGGSENFNRKGEEFRADISFCVQRIRERCQQGVDFGKDAIRRAKTAEARLAAATTVTEQLVDVLKRARLYLMQHTTGTEALTDAALGALRAFVASKQAGAGEGDNQEGGDATSKPEHQSDQAEFNPAPQSDDQACGADDEAFVKRFASDWGYPNDERNPALMRCIGIALRARAHEDALKLIREMAEALEPFAVESGQWGPCVDDRPVSIEGVESAVTAGDLRRARAILTNPLLVAARKGGGL